MALLQIDTISVVARSPYLVLFSRPATTIPSGWSGCWPRATSSNTGPTRPASCPGRITGCCAIACWIPPPWAEVLGPVAPRPTGREIEQIVERIRLEGPVRAADFERSKGQGQWLVGLGSRRSGTWRCCSPRAA